MMNAFGLISLCSLTILVSPCLGFFDMYFDYYDAFQEQRFGCQTEGGHCLNMYPPPAPAGGAAAAEAGEVEMEGGAPTAQPQAAHGHGHGHGAPKRHGAAAGRAGAAAGRAASTPPPATPAPPRRMVANPMQFIRQNCRNFDFDYMSCGRQGGICCHPIP